MTKRYRFGSGNLALVILLTIPSVGVAQLTGVEDGDWAVMQDTPGLLRG